MICHDKLCFVWCVRVFPCPTGYWVRETVTLYRKQQLRILRWGGYRNQLFQCLRCPSLTSTGTHAPEHQLTLVHLAPGGITVDLPCPPKPTVEGVNIHPIDGGGLGLKKQSKTRGLGHSAVYVRGVYSRRESRVWVNRVPAKYAAYMQGTIARTDTMTVRT